MYLAFGRQEVTHHWAEIALALFITFCKVPAFVNFRSLKALEFNVSKYL
jgi:hypothetical protein